MKNIYNFYIVPLLIYTWIGFYGCSFSKTNPNLAFLVYLSRIRNTTNSLTSSAAPTTPPNVISLTPTNNSTNVPVSTPIIIVFDKAMDLTTLTMNATDGPCTGNIQVSVSNFTSCMGGTVSLSTDLLTREHNTD
jgi:hypothetical protein